MVKEGSTLVGYTDNVSLPQDALALEKPAAPSRMVSIPHVTGKCVGLANREEELRSQQTDQVAVAVVFLSWGSGPVASKSSSIRGLYAS